MLTGELPYERTRRTSTIALVRRKSRGVLETALAHPQLALHASDDARDALRQMLDPSPAARPSATALLGHAWLRAAPGAEGADDDATNVTLSVASLETACAAAAQHPSLDSVDSRDSDAAAAPNSAAAPKQPSVSDYNRWSRAAAPKPTRRPSQVALSEIEEVAQSSAPPPALSPLELARAGPMSTPPRPSPDDERASAVADDDAAEPAAGSEHKQYVDRSGNSFALSVLPDDGSADAIVVLGLETKSEAEQLEEHRRICDAVYNSDDDDDNGATASLLCSSDVPRAPGEVALPPADEQPSEQPQPPEPQPVADGWTIDGSDHEHHFYVCSPPELADFDQKIAPVDEDGEFV